MMYTCCDLCIFIYVYFRLSVYVTEAKELSWTTSGVVVVTVLLLGLLSLGEALVRNRPDGGATVIAKLPLSLLHGR